MRSALARKSWTDLSRRPARAVLTTLSLALAVASFGILAMPSLMDRAMTTEVAKARLDNLSVPVDDVALPTAQLAALARLPNVDAVAARSLYATRALVGSRRVDVEVFGVADFANQPLDRVITASPPGPGQVILDTRDAAMNIAHVTSGALSVQAADGSFRALTVAGSGRGLAFNGDTMTDHLVVYADQATVQSLGGFKGVNLLEFALSDTRGPAAQATADAVRAFLAAQPAPTTFANLPTVRTPGDWPLKAAFEQRSKVLDILIVLAVLSATFLLANTIRTMIAEQRREVGVLRAIGASRRDVRRAYLRTATILGVLGAVVGAALGVGLAYVLVGLFARMIFGITPGFAVDWPVVAGSAAAGVAGAVLTAWPTVRRVLRTPVHEALATEGLGADFGSGRLDRVALHTSAVPPPLRMGVRNVARRKGRSAATIVQVALAVATLLGLSSLAVAVMRVTDQSWNVLAYDITLSAQPGGHLYGQALLADVRAQPGVAGAEPADWSQVTYRGTTLYALGVDATTYVREPLTAGRWLTVGEDSNGAPVAVVGSAAARKWHLHPGSELRLTTTGGTVVFTVVGVGGSQANNGFNLYTSLAAAQRATGHPGVANSLLVRSAGTSHGAIDSLASRLEDRLAQAGFPSRSQVMYAGRATEKAQSRSMLVIVEAVGGLIVGISMLGLVNAVTMNIIERTREIGVLRCLGARARDLRRVFRTETLTLALIGFVLAIPLGWALAHALQWLVLHVVNAQLAAPYPLANLGAALIGTIVLSVLVVVIPLARVTRLRPGDALRYG